MNFNSDIQSPIAEATDIVMNIPISPLALRINKHKRYFHKKKDENYYKNQMLIVLSERIIKGNTYKHCADILNVFPERVRQLEAKLKRILSNKMKGYK